MSEIIEQVNLINPSQRTLAFVPLMSIRARFEFKNNIPNRIGRTFENGNRGVLLVGQGGVGKTMTLRRIFEGLNLNRRNREGKQLGAWIASSGASTPLGIYDDLKLYQDSIIFIDEFAMDSIKHLHILKQICSGKMTRRTALQEDSFPFSGLIIGSTNGIKMPNKIEEINHLLATLDRYWVVKVRAPELSPEEYIVKSMDQNDCDKENFVEIDWGVIKSHLYNMDAQVLSDKEKSLTIALWQEKAREILDVTKAQWRNSRAAIDVVLFIKRFLQIKDITKDDEAIEIIKEIMGDAIIFNPAGVMFLPVKQEIVYRLIYNIAGQGKQATFQDIINKLRECGMLGTSTRNAHRILEDLIERNVIVRSQHGYYSTRRNILPQFVDSEEETQEEDVLL